MDWRAAGLSPTFPRPTMLSLLGVLYFLVTVPSTEALPLSYSSLPSFFSPKGLLLAGLAVVIALSLFVALGISFKKVVRKVLKKLKRSKKGEEEEGRETYEQSPVAWPQPFSDNEVSVDFKREFYAFLKEWNTHKFEDRDEFIAEMVKEFPVLVTPSMAMDALQTMVQSQMNEPALNSDAWFRMLRFIKMLERHFLDWDQTDQEDIPESDKTMPSHTHERFQAFLIGLAEEILRTHGDFAAPEEDGYKGFLRLVAFLFGFVCGDTTIAKVMDKAWDRFGLKQRDASRAVVWGYRRWKDDPRRQDPCLSSPSITNGLHDTYNKLMFRLMSMTTNDRLPEGSETQHILFALGFGYEANWETGPLAYMSQDCCVDDSKETHMIEADYMWLMRGRDLAMGNAWQWMCKEGLSEHDRMCERFGQEGFLYGEVVDTVTKYPQEYLGTVDGRWFFYEGGLRSHAARYSPDILKKINFEKPIAWYVRFERYKKYIGHDIEAWLRKNDKHWEEWSKRRAASPDDSQ